MASFWGYETDFPAGSAWHLFGPEHIVCLCAVIAWTCFGWYAMSRLGKVGQTRALRVLGVVILLLEVARLSFLALLGHLTIYELPLHLCGLAVFLECMDAFTDFDWLGQVLYGLCMPGAACALLFCDWTRYPILTYVNLNSFLTHGLLLSYPIFAIRAGRLHPKLRQVWKIFAFLAVIVPPIYWFDRHFSANYLFINVPSPGSPLEVLAQILGNPGYLAGYFALLLLFETALYMPWALTERAHAPRAKPGGS